MDFVLFHIQGINKALRNIRRLYEEYLQTIGPRIRGDGGWVEFDP